MYLELGLLSAIPRSDLLGGGSPMVDWADFSGGFVCGMLLAGVVIGSAAAFVLRTSGHGGKMRWKPSRNL
jgi:hypothetical protein